MSAYIQKELSSGTSTSEQTRVATVEELLAENRKLQTLLSSSREDNLLLSQTISSGLYLDDMLRSLATLTVKIMEVDLCVIMLMDQSKGRLVVRASSPYVTDRSLNFQSVDIDRHTWDTLREFNEVSLQLQPESNRSLSGEARTFTLERLNPLKGAAFKSLLSAPLIAATEHLGLINCYSRETRQYLAEDQMLLNTIANQAALAIKNSQLVDMLAQKNMVKGFFDELLYGTYDTEDSLRQRAAFLGCDLTKPHVVALIELSQIETNAMDNSSKTLDPSTQSEDGRLVAHKKMSDIVQRRIQDSYPNSIFNEQENVLTSIICLSKDPTASRLKPWLCELVRQMQSKQHVRLSVGIGNTCHTITDYRRGFTEASEAAQMGQTLNRESGVTSFNDLGVYRYLYKIAHMDDLRDTYQDQVAHIADYDQRKGTDLLDTLETYLECAGNLTKTSNRLFVHRNTLIQRLERLQTLCEIDLQERGNWLTLQVAIKVYKLRTGNG